MNCVSSEQLSIDGRTVVRYASKDRAATEKISFSFLDQIPGKSFPHQKQSFRISMVPGDAGTADLNTVLKDVA
jgi:hypothetical protein